MAVHHDEPHFVRARRQTRATHEQLGPIKMRASLHETIWGGQRLREIAGKALPEGKRIGESWETALDSEVMTTPHAGKTLGRLVAAYGKSLLGSQAIRVYGERFPLLTKFIDAHDWLSVQVHPDNDYAGAHEGGKLGKTECWYILAAEPGAQVVYGLARETSREALRAAIAANALEPLMRTVELQTGDVIFVSAGTVHAIGSGVTLYELQEYSDVTYRLYDYGRLQANGQPRELHVERALDVARLTPSPLTRITPTLLPSSSESTAVSRRVLVACSFFILEDLRLEGMWHEPAMPSSCRIVTNLQGVVDINAKGYDTVRLEKGDTAVLPASLPEAHLESVGAAATLARAYVPEPGDAGLALWQRTNIDLVELA